MNDARKTNVSPVNDLHDKSVFIRMRLLMKEKYNLFYKHNKYLMKSTVLNLLSSKLAIVGFLFTAFLLVGPSAQAQTQTNESNQFVAPHVAIERLEIETSVLKAQIENLVPGTLAYRIALWKYDLYDAVLNNLYQGKTVAISFQDGLNIYTTDPYADMPASLKRANRAELLLIVHL
jgi:hypothetical protein